MRLRHIPGCEYYIQQSKDCFYKENIPDKGTWKEVFQKNISDTSQSFFKEIPLHIEIGMGKGQFIRKMARQYPEIHFLGIEKYETILMKALQRKHRLELEQGKYSNLYYLCADARFLLDYFANGEINKIYLNFSDPWPKKRHADRRLTSKVFLKIYEQILSKDGQIECKTDNLELFKFSLDSLLEENWNILYQSFDYHSDPIASHNNIMTEYEEKFSKKGQKICKCIATRF